MLKAAALIILAAGMLFLFLGNTVSDIENPVKMFFSSPPTAVFRQVVGTLIGIAVVIAAEVFFSKFNKDRSVGAKQKWKSNP